MKKPVWILTGLMLLLCGQVFAYKDTKTILLATAAAQPVDSLGYNFVTDLAGYTYDWIGSGKLTLWDSPEKKTTLSISALKSIENTSKTTFNKLVNLFVYESWTLKSRKFSFNVKGFSFTGTNANGEDVLFGFVECNQAMKELMKTAPLHINANGSYGATLYTALMNKAYQYDLIFFDGSALKDYKKSARIVKTAMSDKNKMLNAIKLPQEKMVEYGWDSTDLEQAKLSDQLTAVLSDFFNQNQQEFFNYGGDKYYSYLKNTPILFTGFRVIQLWTKDKNGNISAELVSVVPYIVGMPIKAVPAQKLDEWKLTYQDKPLKDYLNTRDFPYAVKKINETVIPPPVAGRFKKALFEKNWNALTHNY